MTPPQVQVLDFVRTRITVAGFCPTYQEICDEVGLTSKSSAHRLVRELVASGHLVQLPGKRRGLDVPDAIDLRSVETAALIAELRRRGVEPGAFSADQSARRSGQTVHCAVRGCDDAVHLGHLFCRDHYGSITELTRRRLHATHKRYRSSRSRRDEAAFREAYQTALDEIGQARIGVFG